MESKKAQAAMEFLMTYGWAILVVLIVIGALAYFGLFNVDWLVPERCTLEAGIKCEDYVMNLDGARDYDVSIQFLNTLGQDISLTNITLVTQGQSNCSMNNPSDGNLLSPANTFAMNQGELATFNSNDANCEFSTLEADTKANKKMKFDIIVKYKDTSSGFDHTVNGELLVKAQQP